MSAAAEVGVIASAALGVFGVAGVAVRFVLVPYLRDVLVKLVQETHRQVTGHDRAPDISASRPTVVDKVDQVVEALATLDSKVGDALRDAAAERAAISAVALAAARSANAAHRRLGAHIEWSREEDSRLWSAVRRQKGSDSESSD